MTSNIGKEEEVVNPKKKNQLRLGFADKWETNSSDVEGNITMEEKKEHIESKEERENRLWEEREAKRRAEVARQLREAAEASAKRREEEDRLWEEGVAKRMAEKERRIREAATNPKAHEEQKQQEEAATKKIAEENKQISESEAAIRKKAQEERKRKIEAEAAIRQKAELAKKLKTEAEASIRQKAELEQNQKTEAEAQLRRKIEEKQRQNKEAAKIEKRKSEEALRQKEKAALKSHEEARKSKDAEKAAAIRNEEKEQRSKEKATSLLANEATKQSTYISKNDVNIEQVPSENRPMKKRVVVGALVALLAIIAIWTFSVFTSDTEEPLIDAPQNIPNDVAEPMAPEKSEGESQNNATSPSKLTIGENYDGGIVFEIDASGKSGKMAHTVDAGPMPWTDANNIDDQLGEGWRLPTFFELSKMYRTIGQGADNSGHFADELYWSATPYDDHQARLLRFRDGNTSYHYNKNVEHRKFLVRAVREFGE